MHYDVMILGGGIAGLTAGVYAARGGKKTVVIERGEPGGQLNVIADIENYPGFDTISGPELAAKLRAQAIGAGAEILQADITAVGFGDEVTAQTSAGEVVARGAIIALGANAARLGLPREQELTGEGVHYCATCDGRFYKRQDVAVVGGSVKAQHDVKYLCGLCNKVYLVTPAPVAGLPENCEPVVGEAVELIGSPLSGLKVNVGGSYRELAVAGVFVARGFTPNSGILAGAVETDAKGFVVTDGEMRAHTPGSAPVFAAGDIVSKSYRQAVTAAGEAATAVHYLLRALADR